MKRFCLEDVRRALVKSSILTERVCKAIPDECLQGCNFVDDLGMDSLDIVLFFQELENYSDVEISEEHLWKCKNVQDILDIKCE